MSARLYWFTAGLWVMAGVFALMADWQSVAVWGVWGFIFSAILIQSQLLQGKRGGRMKWARRPKRVGCLFCRMQSPVGGSQADVNAFSARHGNHCRLHPDAIDAMAAKITSLQMQMQVFALAETARPAHPSSSGWTAGAPSFPAESPPIAISYEQLRAAASGEARPLIGQFTLPDGSFISGVIGMFGKAG